MSFTLSSIGIEEYERGVCENTTENRRALRAQSVPFKSLDNGFLEVDFAALNPSERDASMLERNKLILENPRNIWSEYLPFMDLPLDYWETAPAWMRRVYNKYEDDLAKGTPAHKLPVLPVRCKRIRADGSRCWSWSWAAAQADNYCRFHAPEGSFDYGSHMHRLKEKAQARLMAMQEDALEALEDLVSADNVLPQVRLRAAETILDRTGISAKSEIQFSGQVEHVAIDPAQAIRERLNQLAERAKPELEAASTPSENIFDAEVIEAEVVEAEDN